MHGGNKLVMAGKSHAWLNQVMHVRNIKPLIKKYMSCHDVMNQETSHAWLNQVMNVRNKSCMAETSHA